LKFYLGETHCLSIRSEALYALAAQLTITHKFGFH
jgi:hypothetical protein